MVEEFKGSMTKEFEMTDLGLMKYFLGLEVQQEETEIFISQEKYAKDILKRFKMDNCNPISTPMEPGAKLSKFDGGACRRKQISKLGGKPSIPHMHKDISLVKCWNCESLHGRTSCCTLESFEENPLIYPRNCVTWNVLFESRRIQVDWLL